LLALEGCHQGQSNSRRAAQRKAAMSVEQIRYFLKHRQFLWQVE
jgi:hypothetical protein